MAFGELKESEPVGRPAKGRREEGPGQLCPTAIGWLLTLSILHSIRS